MTLDRREFLRVAARASALAAAGHLPALGGEPRDRRGRGRKRPAAVPAGKRNIFTEPAAIEPVTGYLATHKPTTRGDMSAPEFRATYRIVRWATIDPRSAKSRNIVVGSLTVRRRRAGEGCVYEVTERRGAARREGQFANEWRAAVTCSGALDEVVSWKFTSSIAPGKGGPAIADLALNEEGSFRRGAIERTSALAKTRERVAGPLIAQWSLPHLVARGAARPEGKGVVKGVAKGAELCFAMLADCSVLKPGQRLWRMGEVEVPTAAGAVRMDCYAQTGRGVLPIHYLVDSGHRVQLVTQSDTNWALESVG
ncbi:MAG: hypothetical protein ACYS9X_15270 [Planctomycetota bacterium]|jgi:hypothetical protein